MAFLALTAALVLGAWQAVSAQNFRAQGQAVALPVPLGTQFGAKGAKGAGGGRLTLPESDNLNRILEKANEFFIREKWEEGVNVLQDLLEGRALEIGPDHLDDPAYSVYSEDQRLYIPFTQFCQRLVCTLPLDGLEAYRLHNDAKAVEGLRKALGTLDTSQLGRLTDLYFASSSGPELVSLLADLSDLRGELERGLYLRDRLVTHYPGLPERRVRGLLLRQLHSLALLGESGRFDETWKQLIEKDPKASYRVAGELVPVDKLPDHPAFRIRGRDTEHRGAGGATSLASLSLYPLWEHHFVDKDPYEVHPKKNRGRTNVFFGTGQGGMEIPERKRFRPGATVLPLLLDGDESTVAVKDFDRLLVIDSVSGKLVFEELSGTSSRKAPRSNNMLRLRIAATDYGLHRVHRYGRRLYYTIENRVTNSARDFPYRNNLACFDLDRRELLWTTKSRNSRTGQRVFFQTPPVKYRDWLYAPVRKKRSFALARIDAETGDIDSVVNVHSGGTKYIRVPTMPPVVVGDLLVYSTNAGAVAAFGLPGLELRWLRRYETRTARQPEAKRIGRRTRSFGYQVSETPLRKWKPVPPILHKGRIVLTPIDSDAMLCIDVHSGKIDWILPRAEVGYRLASFQELVGRDGDRIYLVGNNMQCIDLVSGKRIWDQSLVAKYSNPPTGRGAVFGGYIYLPYGEELHRFRCSDGSYAGKLLLPPVRPGDAPRTEPLNLQIAGGMVYAIEDSMLRAFAVPEDLVASAHAPLERVRRLVAVGKLEDACTDLNGLLSNEKPLLSRDRAEQAGRELVRYSGELAKQVLDADGYEKATQVLDRCRDALSIARLQEDPRLILFRVELAESAGRDKELRALREKMLALSISAAMESGDESAPKGAQGTDGAPGKEKGER